MRVSVIIPTYNRAKHLPVTLRAIQNQTVSRDDFEMIVVDDGSQKTELSAIRKIVASCGYGLLEKEHGGLASARNLGADHAKGDILFFLDDDVIPGAETLKQHLASHDRESESLVVIGSLPFSKDISHNAFIWYLEKIGHFDLYRNPNKYPEGRPPLPPMNGNSSIPRDLFFEIGKYDESFRRYGGEDLELGHRLAKKGIKFIYNPRAVGYHNHAKTFSRFCMDMETAGESLVRVYRKFPEIKITKNIDIIEDPLIELPLGKGIKKGIFKLAVAFPLLLLLSRILVSRGEPYFFLRYLLFPFFRLISNYHYALGIQKGLRRRG
jgi:glycosyltransferase involved in cell wall biosynthesis